MLIKPAESFAGWSILEILSRDVLRFDMQSLSTIPFLVVYHHPDSETDCQYNSSTTKARSGDQRRQIFRRILSAEDIGSYNAHQVSHGDGDAGQNHTTTLVGNVVVIPGIKED